MKFITNLCTENWEAIQFKDSLLTLLTSTNFSIFVNLEVS